jgi:hypothetical protein
LTAATVLSVDDYRNHWTEADRLQDPAGYTRFCRRQLEATLRQLRIARPQLQEQLRLLADEEQRILGRQEVGGILAVRLRDAAAGDAADGVPVNVPGNNWTPEAILSQTSSVMAELKGYDRLLIRISRGKQLAEAELERLTTQESETESGLQLLATLEKALEARRNVPADTAEYFSQVERLMGQNRLILTTDAVGQAKSLVQEAQSTQL